MTNKINIEFQDGFKGVGTNDRGSKITIDKENWHPYELLYTALGSCMYSTFLDVINKKKLDYTKVSITIDGTKIDEIPSLLKEVNIDVIVTGADKDDEKVVAKFEKSLKLAQKYCSIHTTLSKIAEMKSTLVFA